MMITTKNFELAVYRKGDSDSSKLALILPGRLDTKDYAHMKSHVDFLSRMGYLAISLDPPGTWESTGDISLFTTTNYVKAVNEVVEHFGKQTILIGHSRGGTVAILAGIQNPKVKAIAAVMATYGPPSSPTSEAIQKGFLLEKRDLPPGNVKSKKQRLFKLPLNYFKDGAKYNTANTLKGCKKPVLLICETRDKFTKPEEVKEVFDTVTSTKKLYELDSDHDYRYNINAINEVNRVVGEFLRKCNA